MRRKLPITLFAPILLVGGLAAGLVACAKFAARAPGNEDEAPAVGRSSLERKAKAAQVDEGSEAEADKDGLKQSGPSASAIERKIIRNGEVELVVKSYEPARRTIEQLVRAAKGYISKSEVHHSLGRVSSATLVLRIPSGRFGGIMRGILELGVVRRESTSSRDVTEQYFDLTARLSNARKLEQRLLDLLQKKAGKVSDLLQVERELARVRETIERFEGKLRLLDNLIDLSTLTVHLSIQQRYTPLRPPTLIDDIKEVLSGSWDALKGFGRALVLLAVALLPWLLPIAVGVWLLLRWIRKRRQLRQSRKPQDTSH